MAYDMRDAQPQPGGVTYTNSLAHQSSRPVSEPRSFEGLFARVEASARKAGGLAEHARELRVQLVGGGLSPEKTEGGLAHPKPVPDGHIDRMTEALDALQAMLDRADGELEILHSKLS